MFSRSSGLTGVSVVCPTPQAIKARQILRQTVSGLIKEARQKSVAGGLRSCMTLPDVETAAYASRCG